MTNHAPDAGVVPRDVTCYAGIDTDEDGRDRHHVLRRTVDPVAGTIVEETASTTGSTYLARTEVTLTVAGATAAVRSSDGNAVGKAVLEGPRWRWTSWRADVQVGGAEGYHQQLAGRVTGPRTLELTSTIDGEPAQLRRLETFPCDAWAAQLGAMTPIKEPAGFIR